MPLNNSRLTESVLETLRGIPLDEDSLKYCDYTYQTKVGIYDSKCGNGCGYCRIEVDCLKEIKIFHNVKEAIAMCIHTGYKMQRLCEYPGDIQMIHGKPRYPDVTEIVLNTCRFWYDMLVDEEETEFIDLKTEEVNENTDAIQLSPSRRGDRDCCIAQTVSQLYPTRQTSITSDARSVRQ